MSVDSHTADSEPRGGAVERLLAGPGVSVALMSLVTLSMHTVSQVGGDPGMFVLQAPLGAGWWQLPLSVFAHAGLAHLAANATMVVVAGGLVAVSSSAVRYHGFFLLSGVAAGVSQIVVTGVVGDPAAVLGASGAALALLGYLVTSNVASSWLLDRVPRWVVVVGIGAVAVAVTLRYYAPGSANVGHLTGALIGLVAGRYNVLRVA